VSTLNPEALTVESFEPEADSTSAYMGDILRCTGCPSGCGIIADEPYG